MHSRSRGTDVENKCVAAKGRRVWGGGGEMNWKVGTEMYALLLLLLLSRFSCVRLFATVRTVVRQAPLSGDSPGKNTGVGCHALLQGIFLTQGSNSVFSIAVKFFTTELPGKPHIHTIMYKMGNK